jgi:DNA adenine methylase
MSAALRAPFPYFGGKSKIAQAVWSYLGDTPNYIEPFAGSLAVLLARPYKPHVETCNDISMYLTNFWRAIKYAPDETAEWADYPVSEIDLAARHRWLLSTGAERLERFKTDPEYYDAQIAGWWVWGASIFIGDGWCRDKNNIEQMPHLGSGMGIHQKLDPGENERGNHAKLPDFGHTPSLRLPHLSDGGTEIHRASMSGTRGDAIKEYFNRLQARLRDVRICCGDWTRVLGSSVTTKLGVTAIYADPPYSMTEHSIEYAGQTSDVAPDVRRWCIENGDNPELRIVLSGYEGEEPAMPDSWQCVAWKAHGGYATRNNGKGKDNAKRERLWISPHCLKPGFAFESAYEQREDEAITISPTLTREDEPPKQGSLF